METAERQISYFESLEHAIKTAFAVYAVIFSIGATFLVANTRTLLKYLSSSGIEVYIMFGLILLGIYFGIYYVIGKVRWLSDVHIQIDRKIFGFLQRSNNIIYSTLIMALSPDERQGAKNISPDKKSTITQLIFSNISDNKNIFHALLKSGIFRAWIRYWMALYGTITFAILTMGSFIEELITQPMYGKSLFVIMWSMTLLHLFLGIVLGNHLVSKTHNTVEHIIELDGDEIAHRFRMCLGELEEA